MRISFCITCKNRFHQISQTLVKNLQDNINNYKDIEFILVDFGSEDGLQEWIISNFKKELSSGYLKYFFTDQLLHWDCSVAKNTAHLYATGDILVNLDCDNFTGKNGAAFVLQQFSIYGPKLLLHQSTGIPMDGSFGRISMKKNYFYLVGGYDETFNPMGYQDTDLIHRLVKLGLFYTPKITSHFNQAVANSKEESILYVNSTKSYLDMNYENRELSIKNINNSKIKANNGSFGMRHSILQLINGELIKTNGS